jgi:two-component system, chemotaxis family, protein-glutamate methylesterase/glutaminase
VAAAAPTRVVVADDSALMRRILTHSLQEAGVEVVGTAADGDAALELCRRLRPDAMTLDLAMPGMDGIGVLKELRAGGRGLPDVPVIVVSAFSPAHGARAVDALAEGAFDLLAKPGIGTSLDTFTAELVAKLGAAAGSKAPVAPRPAPAPVAATAPRRFAPSAPRAATGKKVLAIASATGGPRALAALVPKLPSPLGAGGVIVQHMPPGFTASLAKRLDESSRIGVKEAAGGEELDPGTLLLAAGGTHLRMDGTRTRLGDEGPIGGLKPRADLTIADLAQRFGDRLVLCVLTGMGADGTEGAKAVRAAGGRVLAEDASTCTVYGMPRSVVEAGLADRVVPLHDMARAITEELSR